MSYFHVKHIFMMTFLLKIPVPKESGRTMPKAVNRSINQFQRLLRLELSKIYKQPFFTIQGNKVEYCILKMSYCLILLMWSATIIHPIHMLFQSTQNIKLPPKQALESSFLYNIE